MTFWQPISTCGDSCRRGGEDRVAGIRVVLRMTALLGVLLAALVLVPIRRGAAVQVVARGMLGALGVRMNWRGPAPRPGSLLVSNHVSWLDILVLLALRPVRIVAKHDVEGWPGIGTLASVIGAIFVDRTRPKRLPGTVAEVTGALRAGRSVAVFPEGTTFCGPERGRFRPAMFQAAVNAGAPVVPITIDYGTTAAAFIGDETLFTSVSRVAALRRLTVTVVGAPALRPDSGASRRTLARAAQASVGTTPIALGLAA
ncbi:lysophospholipid acyltransferase family protein [Actinoplanes sp. NBRC 103695]|uniref:lysophospholipid acyltransferase family protein n=1 Tax=Actinoplanes sp. NBRC 103695 TaxID=3032202 RepID=UPI0024A036D1|nr:lysophospholipid acyltransferase family protein [Actinoplanes sp. NBRC 103695]GLY98928.1 1-acyl-sn-glycerol-3-phosphate acyltransferase [Actinoplanes sp. NBRC 103695]